MSYFGVIAAFVIASSNANVSESVPIYPNLEYRTERKIMEELSIGTAKEYADFMRELIKKIKKADWDKVPKDTLRIQISALFDCVIAYALIDGQIDGVVTNRPDYLLYVEDFDKAGEADILYSPATGGRFGVVDWYLIARDASGNLLISTATTAHGGDWDLVDLDNDSRKELLIRSVPEILEFGEAVDVEVCEFVEGKLVKADPKKYASYHLARLRAQKGKILAARNKTWKEIGVLQERLEKSKCKLECQDIAKEIKIRESLAEKYPEILRRIDKKIQSLE